MDHRRAQQNLAPLLRPLSGVYAAAMRLRAWSYAKGLKKSSRPEPFCISVGNISWGGSGKTPLVSWLLDWAKKNSLKAAVLTRGYGGSTANHPLLVSPSTPPEASGDEPLMLAARHPEAQILADPRRRRALAWSRAHDPADLYILDDGMQHLALGRDLNLVLLKTEDLLDGWNRVIPAGSWREGKEALNRADAFLLRTDGEKFEELAAVARERLSEFNVPLFAFELCPGEIQPLQPPPPSGAAVATRAAGTATEADQPSVTPTFGAPTFGAPTFGAPAFGGPPYILCCAVGTPQSVLKSAERALGAPPAESFLFPDHHAYTPDELRQIGARGLPVLTTAKDAVKIGPLLAEIPERRFFVLPAEVKFGPALFGEASFADWLPDRVKTGR